MTKKAFKIGDTVREISTGDIGVVIERLDLLPIPDKIHVNWITNDLGEDLNVSTNKIELVEEVQNVSRTTNHPNQRYTTAYITST